MSRIEEDKDRRIIEEQAATLDTIHEPHRIRPYDRKE